MMKAKESSTNGRVKTTHYLPADLHIRAKVYAARHQTTVTDLIIEGLKLRLKERPEEEGK